MKTYTASKTALNIFRIVATLLDLALIFLIWYFVPYYKIMLTLICIFGIIGIFFVIFYIPLFFKSLEYSVNEHSISKTQGVFFKKNQTIQLKSIQYITTTNLSFFHINDLNFIALSVYGGNMIIPFLSNANFKTIKHAISVTYEGGDFTVS